MRRRGQQEHRFAVMLVTNLFGQAIILRLVGFRTAIANGAQPVRFIKNDQVPLAILQKRALVLGSLESVDGCYGRGLQIPDARIDRLKISLEDLEVGAELVLHLFLPLKREACGSEDQSTLRLATLSQSLPDHSRFYCLAKADFVSQQKTTFGT